MNVIELKQTNKKHCHDCVDFMTRGDKLHVFDVLVIMQFLFCLV